MRKYSHFIDNDWRDGTATEAIERVNPANGDVVALVKSGNVDDLDSAVRAARAAFDMGPWPRMTGQERAAVLFRLADLVERDFEHLAEIEIEEVGKPRRFVEGDLKSAIAFTRHAASMASQFHGEAYTNLVPEKLGLVLRQPVGVVGIIVPWNFPIEILAKKVPFALASGCTAVVKPAELTSGTALKYARLAAEAGLPAGVLNVVIGKGSVIGDAMVRHPGIDMIGFTGSTSVGQQIIRASAETIKRVSLELGGKSANIVFADADLESAVEGTLKSIFAFQGQCCVAGSRLVLNRRIADEFLSELTSRAGKLAIGDPRDRSTDLGSMISDTHRKTVMGFIERGKEGGAKLVCGGRNLRPRQGLSENFIEPTIFDEVPQGTELFTDEIFGPVLAVTRFDTLDEALAIANDTRYGLANSFWTKDLNNAVATSRRLQSGVVWVNSTLDGAPQLPFGGVKASGYGRELGNAGFEDFTELKTVLLSTAPFNSGFGG